MVETMDIVQIKAAHTQFNVASFITDRFSPRAFADTPISEETMNTLFEAASWAVEVQILPSFFSELRVVVVQLEK